MATIDQTPPEQLRLLRLRTLLDSISAELEEAVVETTIQDRWAIEVLTSKVNVDIARAGVLLSLKAHKAEPGSVVK